MKAIIFNAGLGNQIFTYLFYKHLARRFPKDKIYGCYWAGGLKEHYGLELETVFDIKIPRSSLVSDFISKVYYVVSKHGGGDFLESHEYAWWNPVFDFQWIDKQYYEGVDIIKALPFRLEHISAKNIEISKELSNVCSVAVHVRRGDYFSHAQYENFGRFCTEEYYHKAIDEMKRKLPQARFYFFSDDIKYVRKHYDIDATYIDWNTDVNSWQDMFLMSRCKHHIIANSTFSYWAAQLSPYKEAKHIVIAPKKWYIWDDPDIFPESWIRL